MFFKYGFQLTWWHKTPIFKHGTDITSREYFDYNILSHININIIATYYPGNVDMKKIERIFDVKSIVKFEEENVPTEEAVKFNESNISLFIHQKL